MTDNGGCSNCAAMASQLAAARQEIARLQQRVQQLERVIQIARALCQQALAEYGPVVSQKSGVPFGRMAYAKGGYHVAARIWAALSGG